MSYQLQSNESISIAMKRIATEQIKKAIQELSTINDLGVDEAVHQARKRLKKTRAVIRLVRDCLGKKVYKKENTLFRDLGRSLAGLRDGKILIKTLNNLTSQFADTVAPEIFTDVDRELQVIYRQEYQRVLNEGVIVSVINQLQEAQTAIADWEIAPNDWSAIAKSYKRVYKRGYKALNTVISQPTAANFHDWRKRVKYLRYQLRILRPIWSEMMKTWIEQTHYLSNYLGEEHDLAVLKEFVLSQPEKFDQQDTLNILIPLCDRKRGELQSAAIFLGKRIYTEKPQDFVDRCGNYWHIWQQEIA